jgi:hypothetical protein
MHKKILDIKEPKLLTSGLGKSLHPLTAPLWVDGRNILFKEAGVRKQNGYQAAFSAPDTLGVSGIVSNVLAGVPSLYFGNSTDIYMWQEGSPVAVGTGYTGNEDALPDSNLGYGGGSYGVGEYDNLTLSGTVDPASMWSMEDWGQWVVATNGVDRPQIFKGTSFADMDVSAPDTARIFKKNRVYLLAFNTDLGSNWIEWCDHDDLDDWTPTDTNDAGNLPVREMKAIKAAADLGSEIAFYSETQMGICQYVGFPYVYAAKKLLDGIGAVGTHAVCSLGSENYGYSAQGLWKTDGNSFDYVDTPAIRKFIKDNINVTQQSKTVVVHDKVNNQIKLSIPTGSSKVNDLTLGYNYLNGSWTISNIGISAYLEQEDFGYPIIATAEGVVAFDELGVDADAAALEAYIITKPLDCGAEDAYKFVDEIRLSLKDISGNISVQLGGHNNLDDPIDWAAASYLDTGKTPAYPVLDEYIYLYLKVSSTDLGAMWELNGFDFRGTGGGVTS